MLPEEHNLSETQCIRVLVVDDQPFIRQLLQSYLESETDLKVVGSVENGETAIAVLADLQPDIALVDIEMPGMGGLAATQQIVRHCCRTKVLVLSSHDDEVYIRQALQAGAQGYLLKNTPAQELIHAIRYVLKGYLQLGPGLYEKLGAPPTPDPSASLALTASPQDGTVLEPQNTATTLTQTSSDAIIPNREGWSDSTQEQLDSLPKLWTRGLLYFLVSFTAIALPWATFSMVDETGAGRGRLEPLGATIRLDAPAAGMVMQVQATEGQRVRKGQILLQLEADAIRPELQQAQTKLEGQRNRLVQLEQTKTQLISAVTTQSQQNLAQASEKEAQLAQANQALNALKTTAPSQESEKLAQVGQARQSLNAAKTAFELADRKVRKDEAEAVRYRKLWEQGAIPEVKVIELEGIVQESHRVRSQAQSEIQLAQERLQEQYSSYQKLMQQSQSEQEQAETRLTEQRSNQQVLLRGGDLALLKSQEQIKDLEGQITSLKTEMNQSQSQIKALQKQMEQRTVRSPTDGTLFQFPIKQAKTYIQPGQVVAQIAPQGSALILKALMPTQQSGFLKVGMPVKLKFDAYSFQDYGVVPGHLRWVSPDSKMLDTAQGKAEVFEIEVQLNQLYIQKQGKRIELTAGQVATAEVVVRQRRIIDFLIDPFKQLQKGGFKL